MNKLKLFFTKKPMSFDKILMLVGAEFLLVMWQEEHGKFYGLLKHIYFALFTALLLALTIQFVRMIIDVKRT